MAQTFTAQIRNWSDKAKRNMGLVVADAAQGVFVDMSERQPSVKETGGSFELGKVPVDQGPLANTMTTSLNGAFVARGSDAYVAGLAGFELGDQIVHGFTRDYAPDVEYGNEHMEGRFMVREALNGEGGWQARVDASAAKFTD